MKQAPFVVLIGAAMPSVLAEMSFVTNAQEAKLLKTSAYRQRIAESLFDAIRKYQTSLKNVRRSRTSSDRAGRGERVHASSRAARASRSVIACRLERCQNRIPAIARPSSTAATAITPVRPSDPSSTSDRLGELALRLGAR